MDKLSRAITLGLCVFFYVAAIASHSEPLSLRKQFEGEHLGKHIGEEWIHVDYWTPEQQSDGELKPDCIKALLSRDANYMYVILPDDRMIIGKFEFGRVHHSTLAAGSPVLAAGNIRIRNGRVFMLDANSGHYHPSEEHQDYATDWARKRGLIK